MRTARRHHAFGTPGRANSRQLLSSPTMTRQRWQEAESPASAYSPPYTRLIIPEDMARRRLSARRFADIERQSYASPLATTGRKARPFAMQVMPACRALPAMSTRHGERPGRDAAAKWPAARRLSMRAMLRQASISTRPRRLDREIISRKRSSATWYAPRESAKP